MEEELQTPDSAPSPGLSDDDSGAIPVTPPPPAVQSPPADNSKPPPTPPVSAPPPPSPSSTPPSTSNSPNAPPPKQSTSSPPPLPPPPPPPLPPPPPPPDAAALKQPSPSPSPPLLSPPPPTLESNSPPSLPTPTPSPPTPSSSNPEPSTPSAPTVGSGQSPPPSPPSPTAVFPPLSPTVSSPVNPTPPVTVHPPTPPANVENPPDTETPSDSLTPPTLSRSPPLPSDSPPISSNSEKPSTSTPSSGRPAGHGSSLAAPKNSGLSSSTTSSDVSNGDGNSSHGTVIGVAFAGAVIIIVAIFFVISKKKKRRRLEGLAMHYKPPPSLSVRSDGYYYRQTNPMGNSLQFDTQYGSQPPMYSSGTGTFGGHGERLSYSGASEPIGMGSSKSHFSYEEIAEMTHGFSMQNLLGEGGFGCVYKGWLTDGRIVAVKQLKAGSGQGEREFRAEVEIISRVHHRHLVSLVGYCISDQHRSLVYEFVPNNTLEHHLHGRGHTTMDWPNRLKIAIGSARGLAYLHEDCHPRIIHRDIKSANILLDDSFDAQVADFGLAKLSNDTNTHVSTRVMGTFGYMAPEYASSGKLTDRSDVFSFGVVLLELITGRKPVDPSQPLGEESLVEWARPLLNEALQSGNYDVLADPLLEGNYVKIEMFRMLEAAAACVRHSATKRPRMAQVVRALDSEGGLSDLSNGVKYGQSTIFDSSQYPSDMEQFRRMAFGSDSYSSDPSYTEEYGTSSTSKNSNNFSGDALNKPLNPARQNSEEYQSSTEFSHKDMNRRGNDRIPGGSNKYNGRGTR